MTAPARRRECFDQSSSWPEPDEPLELEFDELFELEFEELLELEFDELLEFEFDELFELELDELLELELEEEFDDPFFPLLVHQPSSSATRSTPSCWFVAAPPGVDCVRSGAVPPAGPI